MTERIQLIDDLAAEIRGVAHRPKRSPRVPTAITVALCLSSGVAAAAVTGLLPLGDARSVPENLRLPPNAGTERLSSLRVADPQGGPAWTAQFFEADGRGCVQIGRVQGDTFGSVGADGKFHPQPPGSASYACGGESLASSRLQSADVHSAGTPGQQRFIRFGILGPDVQSLTYAPRGDAPQQLTLSPEGAFLLVTDGRRPPTGELIARYSDGETRRGDIGLGGADAFVPRR